MRFKLILLLLIFSTLKISAQESNKYTKESKLFVDSIYSKLFKNNRINFIQMTIDTSTYNELKKELSTNSFTKKVTYNGTPKIEHIFLSKKERKIINSLYFSPVTCSWTKTDETTHQQKQVENFYMFTKPVFLRNYSICIFYYSYTCGTMCGEGRLAIYKRINGKWGIWKTISDLNE